MVVTSVGLQIHPFAAAPVGADLQIVREPVTVTGLDGRWQIDAYPHALVARAVRRQADADAAAANRVNVDTRDRFETAVAAPGGRNRTGHRHPQQPQRSG